MNSKIVYFVAVLVMGFIVQCLYWWYSFSLTKEIKKHTSDSYFAMCLIVKNDELDLLEWVEYHRRLGCSKFYVFDHNSTVPLSSVVESHIAAGLVQYEYGSYSHYPEPQIQVYDRCLKEFGSRHQFIGFLDSDEFIVVVNKSKSIPDILQRYEKYGGLTLNWKVFGSSGHVNRPPGGILKNYRMCYHNYHIKSIVNTQFTRKSSGNPHDFIYRRPYYAVDTNYKRVKGAFNPKFNVTPTSSLYDVMYINHYNTKSAEDYKRKVAKGKANNSPPSSVGLFDSVNSRAVNDCGLLEMPT